MRLATRYEADFTGPRRSDSHQKRVSGESVRLPVPIRPTDWAFFMNSE